MNTAHKFCLTPAGVHEIRRLAGIGKTEAYILSKLEIQSAEFLRRICHTHGIAVSGIVPPPQPFRARDPAPPPADHRLNSDRRAERPGLVPVNAKIAMGAAERIAREATVRGTTPAALTSRLLEIVAADGLFTALLDH